MKTIALLFALAFSICGCSTVHGFGEDLQKLGSKIESKAR